MKLRIATPNDAAAALSIYSQYIHTPVTFEYELPPQEEFARRIGDTLKRYPYLACADSGRLCGAPEAAGNPDRLRLRHHAESAQRKAAREARLPEGRHLPAVGLQKRRLARCDLVRKGDHLRRGSAAGDHAVSAARPADGRRNPRRRAVLRHARSRCALTLPESGLYSLKAIIPGGVRNG